MKVDTTSCRCESFRRAGGLRGVVPPHVMTALESGE